MAQAITYRHDFGLWWPNYDHKPVACHRRVTKRVEDMALAISLSKEREVCIQAGGHAGVWPIYLSKRFREVHTFEPEPTLFECLRRNILSDGGPRGIIASSFALGAQKADVKMVPHVSAGSWHIANIGTFPVQQIAIDDLNLKRCNLIVLDVEGYEVEALKGAQRTIDLCRPIIHVEELARSKYAIRNHIMALGYSLRREINSDAVYIPN